MNALVNDHLRWAWKIAHGMARSSRRTGADLDDLCQASVVGLFDAATHWDQALGAFTTWSAYRCRHAVQAEMRLLRGPQPIVRLRLSADPCSTDPTDDYHEALDSETRGAMVAEVLDSWSESDRSMFLRRYLHGETAKAMADERGVSHQAVSARCRALLDRMRRAVAS